MPKTTPITAELAELLRRQDGVVTIKQLQQHGFSERAANKRVARGIWRRPLPGILLTSAAAASRRQSLIVGWLWAGAGAAIDGRDACIWYGIEIPTRDKRLVYVVAPNDCDSRSRDFVVVRRATSPIRTGARGFVPYVDAPTALVVAARNAPSRRASMSVLSRGLQTGLVSVRELREARDAIGDKWCRGVDAALLAVGIGLRSPAEKDSFDLFATSSVLPEPLWNQWLDLGDGGPAICADALWEDAGMINEVLGRKYHAWADQFESTEARRARMVAAGLVVQGCTALQVRHEGPAVLSRLERTYMQNAGRGMPLGVR